MNEGMDGVQLAKEAWTNLKGTIGKIGVRRGQVLEVGCCGDLVDRMQEEVVVVGCLGVGRWQAYIRSLARQGRSFLGTGLIQAALDGVEGWCGLYNFFTFCLSKSCK